MIAFILCLILWCLGDCYGLLKDIKRQLDPEELSDYAIRAIAEGRADHAAGRTFTMAEIKSELGIEAHAKLSRLVPKITS